MTVIHRFLVLLTLCAAGFAPQTAFSQFRTDGYGNLVWDPAKQIWVVPGREGFARRLLDGRPGAKVDPLAAGTAYSLLNDRSGAGPTIAIIGGTSRIMGTALEEQEKKVSPRIPTRGPDGRPLGEGARQFLTDFYRDEGYGPVGAPDGRYGNAGLGGPAGEDVDNTPVVASVHLEGIGDLYLTAGGNGGLACQTNGLANFRQTVVYSGVGAQTSYPWNGATGPVREITWVVDPNTDRIQYVQVEFADGGAFRLDGESGHGWVIDPLNPRRVPGGPITALRLKPGDPTAWVEPPPKPRPQPRKAAPAPDDPLQIGRRADEGPDFGSNAAWAAAWIESLKKLKFDRKRGNRGNSRGLYELDGSDDLDGLDDDEPIYLSNFFSRGEPVLYGRLYEVANAAARIRMLYEEPDFQPKNPELWAAISRPRLDAILTGFQQAALEPPKKDVKVVEAKDTTPKPKSKPPGGASGGNIPVPLSGGGTGSAPAGGDGPVTMPDGSVVYRYPPGRSIVSVTLLPPGPSGKRATVTVMDDGSTVVVQEDGTRVEQGPRGRKVILPAGEVVVATGVIHIPPLQDDNAEMGVLAIGLYALQNDPGAIAFVENVDLGGR